MCGRNNRLTSVASREIKTAGQKSRDCLHAENMEYTIDNVHLYLHISCESKSVETDSSYSWMRGTTGSKGPDVPLACL